MPLKTVHLLFIFTAAILCFFVAWWSLANVESQNTSLGTLSAVGGIGLVMYAIKFQKKMRKFNE